MDTYKIADICFGIESYYTYTKKMLAEYLFENNNIPENIINITTDDILSEHNIAPEVPYYGCESTAILRKICNIVLSKYNGLFFHCSALSVDGEAYLFTAPSGTGKSTHARMWREAFKDKVTMINDDKPIIRLIDNKFYVYGTPWYGKHCLGSNTKAPVKAICFLERSENNFVEKVEGKDNLSKILRQTVIPKDNAELNKLFDLLEKLVCSVQMFRLGCNISCEAAELAYNIINNK